MYLIGLKYKNQSIWTSDVTLMSKEMSLDTRLSFMRTKY